MDIDARTLQVLRMTDCRLIPTIESCLVQKSSFGCLWLALQVLLDKVLYALVVLQLPVPVIGTGTLAFVETLDISGGPSPVTQGCNFY